MVDLHCHLDLFPDPAAAFAHCKSAKLTTVTVTTTPRAWPQNVKWASDNPYVHPALGLHPELVAVMKGVRIIGEVGLDGSARYRTSFQSQLGVFKTIVAASAAEPGRILSIHSRAAVKDILDILLPHAGALRPILHWFSGSAAQVRAALALGCYFSVNGSMSSTETGQGVIQAIPLDRLLLESDAPFRKEAATMEGRLKDLEHTCAAIARLKHVSVGELQVRMAQTFETLVAVSR